MSPDPSGGLLARLQAALERYTIPSAGSGPSSTKLVYLTNGLASCYCAILGTVAGVAVYVFNGKADPVYWTWVGAMWTASLGFAGSALKNQHRQAASVAMASSQGADPAASPGGDS